MVGLHVEDTSRCTLACPLCERTVFMEKFGKKNFRIADLCQDTRPDYCVFNCGKC